MKIKNLVQGRSKALGKAQKVDPIDQGGANLAQGKSLPQRPQWGPCSWADQAAGSHVREHPSHIYIYKVCRIWELESVSDTPNEIWHARKVLRTHKTWFFILTRRKARNSRALQWPYLQQQKTSPLCAIMCSHLSKQILNTIWILNNTMDHASGSLPPCYYGTIEKLWTSGSPCTGSTKGLRHCSATCVNGFANRIMRSTSEIVITDHSISFKRLANNL